MGFDGNSIKQRRKKGEGDAGRGKSTRISSSTSAVSFFHGGGKAFSLLLRILFIGLLFIPLFIGVSKLRNADVEEKAATQMVEDRVASVAGSFSALDIWDPNLRHCIKTESLERGNIYPKDTGGIDTFSQLPMLMCLGMEITSLRGISSLSELTYLNLDDNAIEDIFELQFLPKLETLSLADNPVKNIDILLQIENLRKVILPDLPQTYCYEIHRAVKNVTSNVDQIKCRGKWSLAIKEISDKRVYGRPLTDEEERLYYDYEQNQAFMQE